MDITADTALLGIDEAKVSALTTKLSAVIHLSAEEIEFLEGLQINVAEVAANEDFVTEGKDFRSSYILRSGWAYRYRILSTGRRQIIGFILPGDFVGLNINFRRTATYSVATRTPCSLALVEPLRILEIHQKYPILASALSWITVREYSILSEQVVRLGRRTAYERMAHLFLELYHRLSLVGLAGSDEFRMPISYADLSDCLGISEVHVHRTLRRLTGEGLVSRQDRQLCLMDTDRLEEIADNPEAFLEDFAIL